MLSLLERLRNYCEYLRQQQCSYLLYWPAALLHAALSHTKRFINWLYYKWSGTTQLNRITSSLATASALAPRSGSKRAREKEFVVIRRYLRHSSTLSDVPGRVRKHGVEATLIHVQKTKLVKELAALQCIRSVLQQFNELHQLLHKLELRTQTCFEPGEPAHEAALLKLWRLLRPGVRLAHRYSRDWEHIGFQGERPSRDFRAMGMLSLDCLVSFAERSPRLALEISTHYRERPLQCPSFAITGIQLCSDALQLVRSETASAFLVKHGGGQHSFMLLYGWMWAEFQQHWLDDKPENVMAFNVVHQRFLLRVRDKLSAQHALPDATELAKRLR